MHPTRRHVLTALAAWGSAARAGEDGEERAREGEGADAIALLRTLSERLQAAHVPGLSWALIDAGRVRHTGAWGWADLAGRRPMRPDTLTSTASVTKTFTGAALLQCCEQGRCALDDAVEPYLPFALRHPAHPQERITLRHLLTHTSGLVDDLPGYLASYACGGPAASMADWLHGALVGGAGQAKPPFHAAAPGRRHVYSNVGYGLLGLVLEGLHGQPFATLLHQTLLAPLGLSSSRVLSREGAGAATTAEAATPYEFVPSGKPLTAPSDRLAHGDPWPVEGGGGHQQALCLYGFATVADGLLFSSASDLARFALAMLAAGAVERPTAPWAEASKGGPRVLQAGTLSQVFSDQLAGLPAADRPARYQQGLTWRGLGDGVWAHFGSDPGAAAAVALRPRDGRGLVMLANSGRARPLLGRWVSEWMAA